MWGNRNLQKKLRKCVEREGLNWEGLVSWKPREKRLGKSQTSQRRGQGADIETPRTRAQLSGHWTWQGGPGNHGWTGKNWEVDTISTPFSTLVFPSPFFSRVPALFPQTLSSHHIFRLNCSWKGFSGGYILPVIRQKAEGGMAALQTDAFQGRIFELEGGLDLWIGARASNLSNKSWELII